MSGSKCKTTHRHDEISMKVVFNFLIIYLSIPIKKKINKTLTSFIEVQHILSDEQYGFRSKHSTSLALTEFVEKVTVAMDTFQSTFGALIDFKNNFRHR